MTLRKMGRYGETLIINITSKKSDSRRLGYIPIGPLSATTMHIPVIIAGITLGKKAGAQLGLVFGLTSLIRATIQPGITSFCFSPFVTVGKISGDWRSVIIALVPRILLGYLAGVIFEFIKNKFNNENAAAVIGALIGTITNTVLVLGGIYFFFGTAYADAVNIAYSSLLAMLFGVVTTNGIVEALIGAVVTLLAYKAIKPMATNIK